MNASDTRRLPKSGLDLTVMGLGCAQMGNLYKTMTRDAAAATFQAAWSAGIRYVDTAPYYGFTRSERRVGALLTESEAKPVLSTKVGRLMKPDPTVGAEESGFVDPLPFRPVFDYSHDGILRSFEDSQQRLGLISPQILYVHDIGQYQHGERHAHYWQQLTEGGGFRALERLRSEGLVRAIGLGVNEVEVVRDALAAADLDVVMLAGRYTLLEQDSLSLLDDCAATGVGIVIAGVFNSGLLTGNGKFNYADAPADLITRVEDVRKDCQAFGVALEAAAIQFCLAHPAVVSVVCGARSAAQIEGCAAWLQEPIPPDLWHSLHANGVVASGAPLPNAAR